MNILYIEDVSFIRNKVKALLVAEGYTVYEAGTATMAYNLFKRHKIDLALVDINIPYDKVDTAHGKVHFKDGLELSKKMLEEKPDTSVLILSGNIKSDTMILDGIRSGITNFIAKPYTTDRLLSEIIAIRQSRMTPEVAKYSRLCNSSVSI